MKRNGMFAIGLLLLAVSIGSAEEKRSAASGQVEAATLSAMGIGGLERISDAEGQNIRGRSFVIVRSRSSALGRVDTDFKVSGGAPRLVRTRARESISVGGFSYRASSRGFAYASAY